MGAGSHTGYPVSRSTLARLFPWATYPGLGWKRLWWGKVVWYKMAGMKGIPGLSFLQLFAILPPRYYKFCVCVGGGLHTAHS